MTDAAKAASTPVSAFDLFKIGIGPSSSHTVGPMIAARQFVCLLQSQGLLPQVATLVTQLYGSLSATGRGHGTDRAVLLGLAGHRPDHIDPDTIEPAVATIQQERRLQLLGVHAVAFDEKEHLLYMRKSLPQHPNGLRFIALDAQGQVLAEADYFSVGGGFVVDAQGGSVRNEAGVQRPPPAALPFAFDTGAELLAQCRAQGLSIAALMMANETQWRPEAEVRSQLLQVWEAMAGAVRRGCASTGTLPGRMQVRRRAADLFARLQGDRRDAAPDPLAAMDWVNLYAMAVNEENAAGGRVVTAPTNGAAGVIPAVLHYHQRFFPGAGDEAVVEFLLTAAAVGILYKKNGSLSGAEVGCQGEVGVACSMAAGALAAVMGGTPGQVENAAEIGMEHNLGMTCDPVSGLVQIPCIERNAMGAVKAINAARMALRGDGSHVVSLDKVIQTMMQTGADMKTKYKETSRGGLAVNIVEC
ncbi:L-serine ammonia-lyase [Acidovorax cavernicola]|uniref:L-serine dehydratase n=1 Tax=Acidovorax cavernicola TaxID=1675792 RepID=A0A9X8GUP9_9BURK|nr:L-serine ammonia-lyase [Acidovorax cavernicola]RIX78412.1 L-serine ammonia-lyase [Acidovorax cavernicola]